MTRLRRLHFLYLNKQLAACRKDIFEKQVASDGDMARLATLLHQQGEIPDSVFSYSIAKCYLTAKAIRDFQYIRGLDFLPPEERRLREKQGIGHFPMTAQSDFSDIFPFQTENYRCLPRESAHVPKLDSLRDFLRRRMPVRFTLGQRKRKGPRKNFTNCNIIRKCSRHFWTDSPASL